MWFEGKRLKGEDRHLAIALAKSFPMRDGGPGDIYCGHLTPSEILALVKNGATPETPDQVECVQAWRDNGYGNPTWFYFTPGLRVPTGKNPWTKKPN